MKFSPTPTVPSPSWTFESLGSFRAEAGSWVAWADGCFCWSGPPPLTARASLSLVQKPLPPTWRLARESRATRPPSESGRGTGGLRMGREQPASMRHAHTTASTIRLHPVILAICPPVWTPLASTSRMPEEFPGGASASQSELAASCGDAFPAIHSSASSRPADASASELRVSFWPARPPFGRVLSF